MNNLKTLMNSKLYQIWAKRNPEKAAEFEKILSNTESSKNI